MNICTEKIDYQERMRNKFTFEYNELLKRIDQDAEIDRSMKMIGIETEYLLVDKDYKPVSEEIRNTIVDKYSFLKRELGASQIEINSNPIKIKEGYKGIYTDLLDKEQILLNEVEKVNCHLIRIALYMGDSDNIKVTNNSYRYIRRLDAIKENRPLSISKKIGNVELGENIHELIGGCQSIHYNFEVSSADAIRLLNKSIEISPYILALSVAAPIINLEDTGYSDIRYALWKIGYQSYSGDRVCLPNRYYTNLSQYWMDVRNQIYYDNDEKYAFKVNQKMYWKSSRIKLLDDIDKVRILLEVRYVAIQPSIEEDIAIGLVLYSILINEKLDRNSKLLSIYMVKENMRRVSKDGIKSKLYIRRKGISEMDATSICRDIVIKSILFWRRYDKETANFIRNILSKRYEGYSVSEEIRNSMNNKLNSVEEILRKYEVRRNEYGKR